MCLLSRTRGRFGVVGDRAMSVVSEQVVASASSGGGVCAVERRISAAGCCLCCRGKCRFEGAGGGGVVRFGLAVTVMAVVRLRPHWVGDVGGVDVCAVCCCWRSQCHCVIGRRVGVGGSIGVCIGC